MLWLVIATILLARNDPLAVGFFFWVHSPPGGLSVKIFNNLMCLVTPHVLVVYNAVGSGLAAAECTLWQWAWLAKKNFARVKCKIKERER